MGQSLRGGQRLAILDEAIGKADRQRFLRADRAAGQNEIERAAHADQPRQAHRAAVDQRHAPAPAEHAENGVALDDAQVGQQRQLQPAGHRIAADRRDQRLGERQTSRPHRAGARPLRIERVAARRIADRRQVRAAAEMTAGAP